MEGYMDVIMAHQCGVTNAVASMGTAITETQVNILKKLSKNLILSLDADAAGEEAMLRTVGYENILKAEMRVILLPEGKDPDEVIREDMTKWQDLVNNAMPLIDFLFDKTAAKLDLATARDKSFAVDKLLPVIAAITDPIRQAHYLQKLAALVKVDMNTIKVSLSRLKPTPVRRTAAAPKPSAVTSHPLASSSREEYCLALLLQYPELRDFTSDIALDFFRHSENREIFNCCQGTADVSALKERLDPALHEHLDVIINRELPGERNNIEGRFNDCVMELRKTYLRSLAAQRADAGEASMEIGEQLHELEAGRLKKRNAFLGKIRR
ncbi:MAG: toprim domain-containing protein [Dehalococcoidales bacterium]